MSLDDVLKVTKVPQVEAQIRAYQTQGIESKQAQMLSQYVTRLKETTTALVMTKGMLEGFNILNKADGNIEFIHNGKVIGGITVVFDKLSKTMSVNYGIRV